MRTRITAQRNIFESRTNGYPSGGTPTNIQRKTETTPPPSFSALALPIAISTSDVTLTVVVVVATSTTSMMTITTTMPTTRVQPTCTKLSCAPLRIS